MRLPENSRGIPLSLLVFQVAFLCLGFGHKFCLHADCLQLGKVGFHVFPDAAAVDEGRGFAEREGLGSVEAAVFFQAGGEANVLPSGMGDDDVAEHVVGVVGRGGAAGKFGGEVLLLLGEGLLHFAPEGGGIAIIGDVSGGGFGAAGGVLPDVSDMLRQFA